MPTLAPPPYSVFTDRFTSAGTTTLVTHSADLPPFDHLYLKDERRTSVNDTSLLYLRDDEEDNYHDVHNDPFPPLRERELRGHPTNASSWPQKRSDVHWTHVEPIPPEPTPPVSTNFSGEAQPVRYQPPTEAPPSLSSASQVSLGSWNTPSDSLNTPSGPSNMPLSSSNTLSGSSNMPLSSSNAPSTPVTGFSRFFKKGKATTEDERREKQLKKEAVRAEKEKRHREQAQRDAEDFSPQAMISMAVGGSTF